MRPKSLRTAANAFRVYHFFAIFGSIMLHAGSAPAARVRHRFEPTDLELVSPGRLEIDHQTGFTAAGLRGPHRIIVSDFELNLGWKRNIELDIDGAWVNVDEGGSRQWAGDALWTSVKLGLLDLRLDGTLSAIALGLQLGPRFPTLRTGKGVGYSALGLAGITLGRGRFVVNAGYLIDPGTTVSTGRPSAFLLGLDVTQPIGSGDTLALLTEVAAVGYASREPYELDIGLGVAWVPSDDLGLSVTAIGGRLAGGDHLGAMLGMTPSTELW